LRLFVPAAGGDSIKESNLTGLAFNFQDELIALETVDKIAVLVKNREVGLDQFSVDTHDLVAAALRALRERECRKQGTRY
jgi:hypothetical protein